MEAAQVEQVGQLLQADVFSQALAHVCGDAPHLPGRQPAMGVMWCRHRQRRMRAQQLKTQQVQQLLHEQALHGLGRFRLVGEQVHDGKYLRIAEVQAIDQLGLPTAGELLRTRLQACVAEKDIRGSYRPAHAPMPIVPPRSQRDRARSPGVGQHLAIDLRAGLRSASVPRDHHVVLHAGDVALEGLVPPAPGDPRVAGKQLRHDGRHSTTLDAGHLSDGIGQPSRTHARPPSMEIECTS